MRIFIAALHGILTSQTDPSWPDKFSAWVYERDPEVHVTVRRYWAGPFPCWNCWVQDRWLARGLAAELELFLRPGDRPADAGVPPAMWFVAHSNGAVIALLAARRLIARGYPVGGLILTGAACEPDVNRNGVASWLNRAGKAPLAPLGAAIAYSSAEDEVLPAATADQSGGWLRRAARRVYAALIWPYGNLGRTGWLGTKTNEDGRMKNGETPEADPRLFTRWHRGGHSTYFRPENIERTFKQIYQDIAASRIVAPASGLQPSRQTSGLSRPWFRLRAPRPRRMAESSANVRLGPLDPGRAEGSSASVVLLGQLPSLPAGAIETWLLSAAAVVSMGLLARKLFVRKPPGEVEFVSKAEFRTFRERVEQDLTGLRDKIDARFLGLSEKMEQMKGELLGAGERRGDSLHRRINELEAGLARVDERTLKR